MWFRDDSSFIHNLTNNLASINILYVKAFQVVAFKNHLINENTNNQLLRFIDNVPWNHDDIDFFTLVRIRDELKLDFVDGLDNPIHSGMISLVFKAFKRETNEPLIVKMKRLNIDHKLQDVIDDLLYFADILSFIPFVKRYQISQSIRNCIDIVCDQTNFNMEVENMIRMKNNCNSVQIPSVLQEITNKYPNVIIMEYIDGVSFHTIVCHL
jgi:predicted unusual protein kinase regulating ubiquinone biosynthesis (AarF/ABC1/UbiB family)